MAKYSMNANDRSNPMTPTKLIDKMIKEDVDDKMRKIERFK